MGSHFQPASFSSRLSERVYGAKSMCAKESLRASPSRAILYRVGVLHKNRTSILRGDNVVETGRECRERVRSRTLGSRGQRLYAARSIQR